MTSLTCSEVLIQLNLLPTIQASLIVPAYFRVGSKRASERCMSPDSEYKCVFKFTTDRKMCLLLLLMFPARYQTVTVLVCSICSQTDCNGNGILVFSHSQLTIQTAKIAKIKGPLEKKRHEATQPLRWSHSPFIPGLFRECQRCNVTTTGDDISVPTGLTRNTEISCLCSL